MPEVEENKLVDIDTSGPDTEVELEETQSTETETPEVEASTNETEEASTPVETVEASEEKKEEPQTNSQENELEKYSEGVQKRIAKLTKKWREAERQKDEALTFAQAQIQAKKEAEEKISRYEPEFFKNAEDSIVNGLEAAKAKLAAAREANDLAAESEALTTISELGYKKAKFNETKVAQEQWNEQQEQFQQPEINLNRQQASQGTPDPKAETWASRNAWFGQDTAMTYTAFDLHKKLTEQEGYDPQSDEYYQEIDKRIRLEFPHKFGNNTSDKGEVPTKPVQTVASAKRSTNTGRKTVRLTSSQVAIAKKLGVPLEDYAKQLMNTEV